MGELSLINYVISCSLKWLGQSSEASGDGAAPHGQHAPQQRGKRWKSSQAAWKMWLSSKRWQRRRRISHTQFMCSRTATEAGKRGQKGKMRWQKAEWEIRHCQNPGRGGAGSNGGTGNRIQGTALPEKCGFILPKKTNCKKSTFSTSITDTDLAAEDLYQRNEKSWGEKSPSLPWTGRKRKPVLSHQLL